MLRRSCGTRERRSFCSERPPTITLPAVGSISLSSSLMNVDLPEPEGPTRKTNSPLSIVSETSSRPKMPGWYTLRDLVEQDHRRAGAGGLLGAPPALRSASSSAASCGQALAAAQLALGRRGVLERLAVRLCGRPIEHGRAGRQVRVGRQVGFALEHAAEGSFGRDQGTVARSRPSINGLAVDRACSRWPGRWGGSRTTVVTGSSTRNRRPLPAGSRVSCSPQGSSGSPERPPQSRRNR